LLNVLSAGLGTFDPILNRRSVLAVVSVVPPGGNVRGDNLVTANGCCTGKDMNRKRPRPSDGA
jgi:hypothetical protein